MGIGARVRGSCTMAMVGRWARHTVRGAVGLSEAVNTDSAASTPPPTISTPICSWISSPLSVSHF